MISVKSKKQQHPNIIIAIVPEIIHVGQMIQISTVFTNEYAQPVYVKEIFMEIIDSTGRVAWPLSVMERGASGFAKLISTAELQPNTRYTVRISENSDLSNHRFGFFKTTKRKLPLLLVPLLVAPTLLIPLIPKKAEIPVLYIYRTELDKKVCSTCKANEGLQFSPGDKDIIRIGPPELGGETHFRCRCHYDMKVLVNAAYAKVLRIHKAVFAIRAINQIKNLKNKEINIKA